jgi:DNA helicase II / ATP-dependent DNA helicase PcrA
LAGTAIRRTLTSHRYRLTGQPDYILLDAALAQDRLLEGVEEPWGLQVMTFHKSKAKQFDGEIVVREARKSGESFVSSFVWWGDEHPYTRSRRILRVGITRAKFHTVILDPFWPKCPILEGHKL